MGTGKVKSVASNSEGISTCPSENLCQGFLV